MAKKEKVGLAAIVKATLAGTVIYTHPMTHVLFVEKGLVEINPEMLDAAKNVATRATQAGIDAYNAEVAAKQAKSEKVEFVIATVAAPAASARSGRETIYPFDKLEVGQSFFVANTAERPAAAKSLASTVSSANNRFAVPAPDGSTRTNVKGETVPVMVKTRTFIVRDVDGEPWGQAGVKGAGIWRTA